MSPAAVAGPAAVTGRRAGWEAARARVAQWAALDSPWERPGPTAAQRRNDLVIAVAFALGGAVTFELVQSLRPLTDNRMLVYALIVGGSLPLAWRRRAPLLVALVTQLDFFLVALVSSGLAAQFFMQLLLFFGLFSGVAWGRDRRATYLMVAGVLLFMFGWLTYQYALSSALAEFAGGGRRVGVIPPEVAAVIYGFGINIVFFGGAVLGGQAAWRAAWGESLLRRRTAELEETSAALRTRAVVDERLRIARELHDVIAHHVSVMGVQAAAARRVLTRSPDEAAVALTHIEESSRRAVGELRGLLGTLRAVDGDAATGEERQPEPGLGRLAELVDSFGGQGLQVTLDVVATPEAVARVPGPIGLSLYRVVQEALSNVRRHSTARSAHVALRVEPSGVAGGHVEVEVVDDGRPFGGTSGTGLGMLGMRERVSSHGGTLEVGPRLTGGYRVRVRFPL